MNTIYPMVRLVHVCRSYGTAGGRAVEALRHVTAEIAEGEFVAVTGPSGCGKSTLLHLLAALDTPTSGEIWIGEAALHKANEKQRTAHRRETVGIIFQFFHLMPTLTVAQNAALPLLLKGTAPSEAAAAAERALALVGLADKVRRLPHQLSGGEMQRVAIARALVHSPRLLLADEPTGSLDSASADRVMDVIRGIHENGLATIVLVTHSRHAAAAAGREIRIEDGTIVSDSAPPRSP